MIGQVAKTVGLPEKTIRFYEDEQLLSPVNRSANGYRSYSQANIKELEMLKQARDLGLPLSEVKKLMKGCTGSTCHHDEKYIENTIENYISLLTGKIHQLKALRSRMTQLKRSVALCKEDNKEDGLCCDILHQLITLNPERG